MVVHEIPIVASDLPESEIAIENIGWTLGNACPYGCKHCYSVIARVWGKELALQDVNRIVGQLAKNNIKTVNLGGNEPIFTNGLDPRKTILPYIIRSLVDRGIVVGLTTAGVSLHYLYRRHKEVFLLLNDIDVSIDSPFKEEHDQNRGSALFDQAVTAARICQSEGIEHTLVTCGMVWNLSKKHLDAFVNLAKETGSNIRINFIKPTEQQHMNMLPTPMQFYSAFQHLLALCDPLELGEPFFSALLTDAEKGCPCGRKSFRIHSITPDGKVPVSPCVYVHDYRAGDLLKDELYDIVLSPQFRAFRQRHASPHLMDGCTGCKYLKTCRGGCAARAFLTTQFHNGKGLFIRDPYCLKDFEANGFVLSFPRQEVIHGEKVLVHKDYLCTLIMTPK